MPYMTRPFYCEHHHTKATHHVVYGGTRKGLVAYEIDLRIIAHITPHIVSWVKERHGWMPLGLTCGIVGCGVDWIDHEHPEKGVKVLDVHHTLLPIEDFIALYHFRKTGYELQRFKRYAK